MGELQRRRKVEKKTVKAYAVLGVFIFIGCLAMAAVYVYASGIMPVTSQATYAKLKAYSKEVDAAELSLARTEFIAISLFSLSNKTLTYGEARQLEALYGEVKGRSAE